MTRRTGGPYPRRAMNARPPANDARLPRPLLDRPVPPWSGLPGPPATDAGLARRLVDRQFPQWSGLPIASVDLDGWDNRSFRLGAELTVRLPSGDWYAEQVDKEQRWLPVLAPQLPLPIPEPVAR